MRRWTGATRAWFYLDSTAANGYVPALPSEPVDLIYLCFPNNPTGATATRAQLAAWAEYARQNRALILFDAAYEAFIRDPSRRIDDEIPAGARRGWRLSFAATPNRRLDGLALSLDPWCPRSAWPGTTAASA